MNSTPSPFDLEARRRLAVTRVNEGGKHKDVAAFLGVSLKAVGKWMAAYRASGDGLKARPRLGAKPKLTARQERGALAAMPRSPKAFGYKTDLWTARRPAEVIDKKYGVRFNSNDLTECLTRRGDSPQNPEVRAVERDDPAIARWAAEDWPRVGKRARDERADLVLIDESGFFLNPVVRRTWAARGRTPVLTGFGRHRDKVSTIVAISVAPMRRRVGLCWRTDPDHYVDAAGVASFLRGLLRRLRGRVVVIWDGGSDHKGPAIRELCRRYPRPRLERLPAYAPDLNPVEMLWSYLKHGRMPNFVPRHARHLDRVVGNHLAEFRADPDLIRLLWAGSRLTFPHKNLAT